VFINELSTITFPDSIYTYFTIQFYALALTE